MAIITDKIEKSIVKRDFFSKISSNFFPPNTPIRIMVNIWNAKPVYFTELVSGVLDLFSFFVIT